MGKVKIHQLLVAGTVATLLFAGVGQIAWAQKVINPEQFLVLKPPRELVGWELEQFRSQLQEYYADLAKLYPYIAAHASPDLSQRLAEAQKNVPLLSHEELTVFYKAFAPALHWRDGPKILLSVFQRAAKQKGEVKGLAITPEGLTSHSCPAGAPGGVNDVFIAREVAQGLAFGVIFAPSDLVVVTVALGAGGGGTISAHPIKIALQIGFETAEAAALALEHINAVHLECEGNNHQAILHDIVGPRVDVTVSSRASQASLDQHDADIKARLGRIEGALAEIIDLLLTPQGRRPGFPKKP